MKIEYDKDADAAYIYLADEMTPVARSYPCDPVAVESIINLDFDATGRLVGIEILGANKKLSRDLLLTAKRIDKLPREGSKRQPRH